jgi:hypothetical protein
MQQDAHPSTANSCIADHRFASSAHDPTTHASEPTATTESSSMRGKSSNQYRLVDGKPLLLLGFVHERVFVSAHR